MTNPAHHEKIQRILDISYAPVVLTSDPPKRRLSFSLDSTRYRAVVTLTNVRDEIVPLR